MKKNYTFCHSVKPARYPFLFFILTVCLNAVGFAAPKDSSDEFVTDPAPSTIITNPFNKIICQGGNTFFSVKASSADSYLWQVSTDLGVHWATASGGIYTGETKDTLRLTFASEPAKYRCIVKSAGIADTSTAASLNFFIVEQSVVAKTTQICRGDSTTITIGSTQPGINYYLREGTNIVAGPVSGTGAPIVLGTGPIFVTKSYSVLAQKSAVGTAIDFDGVNDYVKLDNAFPALNTFTFSAWVYPTSLTNGKIFSSSDYELTVIGGGIKFQSATMGTVSYNAITQNDWTHVTVSYNGSTLRLYLNGTEVNSIPTTGALPGVTSLVLGKDNLTACCYFSGKIDELRMWNKYLSLDEVREGMSNCIEGTEANLTAYYRFDDGSGSPALSDVSGKGHNGTLTNMDITNDWVMGTSSCGDNLACTRIMLQTPKITMYSVIPLVTASAVSRCAPGVVKLTATASKGNLSWYSAAIGGTLLATGATYTTPILNATTSYFVSSTDQGCTSARAEATATIKPMPDITVTVKSATLTANQGGAIYQWIDCKKENQYIAGATDVKYTAPKIGTYAVVVNLNGCVDTSVCTPVSTIGIDELTKAIQFTVFPNPSSGTVTVHSSDAGTFTIVNQLGQVIQTLQLSGANNYTMTIDNLSNGIYMIMGLKDQQVITQKIVIEK